MGLRGPFVKDLYGRPMGPRKNNRSVSSWAHTGTCTPHPNGPMWFFTYLTVHLQVGSNDYYGHNLLHGL